MKVFSRTYARLVVTSMGTAGGVALLGYYPTLRLAGSSAICAMMAGIGISLVAGCVGSIPLGLAQQGDATKAPQAILLATLLRFLVVLALAAVGLLGGWFDRPVLGLWVGLSYLVMLVVDAIYAVHVIGGIRESQP